MSFPEFSTAVALVLRNGDSLQPIVAPNQISPQDKATALYSAFQTAKPGDVFVLDFGDYILGQHDKWQLPSGTPNNPISIIGMGRGLTRLIGSCMIDGDGSLPVGVNFGLGNTRVKSLSLINQCWNKAEDGGCVGFNSSGNFVAEIEDCDLWCPEWTVYDWSFGNLLTIRRSFIVTGCVGIGNENSGVGSTIRVHSSTIIGNASLSVCSTNNAVRDPATGGVFGAILRGGLNDFRDTDFIIKGFKQDSTNILPAGSFPSRAAAVTDHGGKGDVPAGNTRIQLHNCRAQIIANDADPARCLSLDIANNYVKVDGALTPFVSV